MVKSVSAGVNFAFCHVPLSQNAAVSWLKKGREFLYVDPYTAECFTLIPEPVSSLSVVAAGGQSSCFHQGIGDKEPGARGIRISREQLVNRIHKPLCPHPLVTSLKIQKAYLAGPLGICITEAINTSISSLRLPRDLEKC